MLTFVYACPVKYGNPMGNRISKTVTDMTGKKAPFTTYYTRDAQGNTMAVYDNSSLKSDIAICELDRPYLEKISRNIITYKAKSLIAEEDDFYQNSINEYISQNWQGDSCKYKYMSLISEKNIPCFIEQEDYNIIEQLYYQDFGYFQSVETSERKSYLSQKYNEHYENMGDRTYCFIQELSIAMEQPIDAFEAWLMHQKRIDLRSKLDAFYTELAQTSIYYGILNDTAYQDSLYWKEQHLYGSLRLGIAKPELEVTNYTPSNFSLLTSNFKNYELTNHLGNILATIKDEKQQIDQNADGIVDYYEPIVITANDYYPFGMLMPNRSFSLAGSGYRFGFNGKENDRETGTQDYGFRIYNPQIGKFLSVDPLTKSYPWYTPYQFAGNKPIWATDVDGLEELIYQYRFNEKAQTVTLIRKINNVERIESHYLGRHGYKDVVIDRRTGKAMNPSEIGQVQYQYYDANGNRMNIRRDLKGNYVKGENEMMPIGADNYMGSIYIGPDNPKTKNAEGKLVDDYRREPQDKADAAAMKHDMNYDKVKASGVKGALFDPDAVSADKQLREDCISTELGGVLGAKDPYTGERISLKTFGRAEAIRTIFNPILINGKALLPKLDKTKDEKK